MSDDKVIAAGKSAEEIAYHLMEDIQRQEKAYDKMTEDNARKYILTLYHECIGIVAKGMVPTGVSDSSGLG